MKLINIRSLIIAVGLVLLLLGACAPKPTAVPPSEKPEYIDIVYNSDISGPYSLAMSSVLPAWEEATDYINSELGGVYGVPWKYTLMDTAGKVEVTLANFTKIKTMNPRPLGMSLSHSHEAEALLPLTREAEMVTMTAQTVGSLYPAGYHFSVLSLYPDVFGYFADWLIENWNKDEPPKLAFIKWDNAFGRGVSTDEVAAYAKKKGIDIVAEEYFGVGEVDVTTQLIRIRASGADWIWGQTLAGGVLTVLKGLHEVGLDTPIVFPLAACVDSIITFTIPEEVEGSYFIGGTWPLSDYAHPGIKIIRGYFERSDRGEGTYTTVSVSNGWAVHMKFYQAIKQTVDRYGWENLDGKHIKDIMETWEKEPIFHGIQEVDYTNGKRSHTLVYMGQVQNGKHVHLQGGEWFEAPDLRPDSYKQ